MFRGSILQLTKQKGHWKSLCLCSVIQLSNSPLMKKEFNLQEGWSGNFLCIVSVISPDAVLPPLLAKQQDIQFLHVSEGSKEGPEQSQCK